MAVGSGVVRAGRAYVEIYADNDRFMRKLHETEATFRNFGSQMTQASAQMLASMTAIAAPLAVSTKFYSEFDDVMRSVYSTAGKISNVDMNKGLLTSIKEFFGHPDKLELHHLRAAQQEYLALTKTARELGATTSFTAKEAANSMLVLARAGFAIAEIQDSVSHILNLSRATGTEVAEATQIMIGALRSFNIEATRSEQVVDLLVATANNSPQSLADIGSAMKYIGPVAKALHLSLRDTLADLGALANFNIKGEQGGTALRNIYLRLSSAKNQAKLKDTFGVELVGADGEFRKIIPVLKEIQDHIKETGMSTAEVANAFKEIFGMRSAPAALSLMNADLTRINEALADTINLAEDQSEMMDQGLGGAIRMLISRFQELQIAMVNAFSGPAKVAVKALTLVFDRVSKFIENNKWLVKTITYVVGGIAAVAAGFGAMSLAIGVASRSASSLMTQLRKLGNLRALTLKDAFNGLAASGIEKIGSPDIQTQNIDRAREATRYLSENLSGLSKTTVNIIKRFNRLGKSFDLISNKAEAFRKASAKFAQSGRTLNETIRPLEGYIKKVASNLGGLTKATNATRASFNRYTQSAIKAKSASDSIISVLNVLERSFYNVEKEIERFEQVVLNIQKLIQETKNEFAAFRDVVKGLASDLKAITRVGRQINRAFESTANKINSSSAAIENFNTKLAMVAETSNVTAWANFAGQVRNLADAFKSLATAVGEFNRAFRQIDKIQSASIKKIRELLTTFEITENPKAFASFINKRKEEAAAKRKNRTTTGDAKSGAVPVASQVASQEASESKDEKPATGAGKRLLNKAELAKEIVKQMMTIVEGLVKSTKSLSQFFRTIDRGIDRLLERITGLKDGFVGLEKSLSTFLGNTRTLQKEFNSLTTSIQASVDGTGRAVRSLRQYREAIKSLSISKFIRETNNLDKSMVNLGTSLQYLIQNQVPVENAILSIGVAFEKAAVGAVTMSTAVRNLVQNLKEIQPTMKNLEKRLKTGNMGALLGAKKRPSHAGREVLATKTIDAQVEKVVAASKRPIPTFNDSFQFVSVKDLQKHAREIAAQKKVVEQKEQNLNALKEKDRKTAEEARLNKTNDRIMAARAYGQKEVVETEKQYRDANQTRGNKEAVYTSQKKQREEIDKVQKEGRRLISQKYKEAVHRIKTIESELATHAKDDARDSSILASKRVEKRIWDETYAKSQAYTASEVETGLRDLENQARPIGQKVNDLAAQKAEKEQEVAGLNKRKGRIGNVERFWQRKLDSLDQKVADAGYSWSARQSKPSQRLLQDRSTANARRITAKLGLERLSAEWAKEVTERRKRINGLVEKNTASRDVIKAGNLRIAEINEEIRSIGNEIAKNAYDQNTSKSTYELLAKEKEIEKAIKSARARKGTLTKEIKKLKASGKPVNLKINEAVKEQEALDSQIRDFESTLERTRNKISRRYSSSIFKPMPIELRDRLASLKGELETISAKNQTEQENIAQRDQQKDTLLQRLNKHKEKLSPKFQRQVQELKQASKEFDRLEKEVQHRSKPNPKVVPERFAKLRRFYSEMLAKAQLAIKGVDDQAAEYVRQINDIESQITPMRGELRKLGKSKKDLMVKRKKEPTQFRKADLLPTLNSLDAEINALQQGIADRAKTVQALNDELANLRGGLSPLQKLGQTAKKGALFGTAITDPKKLLGALVSTLRANSTNFIQSFFQTVTSGGKTPTYIQSNPAIMDSLVEESRTDVANYLNSTFDPLKAAWMNATANYNNRTQSVLYDTKGRGGKKFEGLSSNLIRHILNENARMAFRQYQASAVGSPNEKQLANIIKFFNKLRTDAEFIGAKSPFKDNAAVMGINAQINRMRGVSGLENLAFLPSGITTTAEAEASSLMIPKVHDVYTNNGKDVLKGTRSNEVRARMSANLSSFKRMMNDLRKMGQSHTADALIKHLRTLLKPAFDQSSFAMTGQGAYNNQPFIDSLNNFFTRTMSSLSTGVHDVRFKGLGMLQVGSRSSEIRNVIQKNLDEVRKQLPQATGKRQATLAKLEKLLTKLSRRARYIGEGSKFNDAGYVGKVNSILKSVSKRFSLLPTAVGNLTDADKGGYLLGQVHDKLDSKGNIIEGTRSKQIRSILSSAIKEVDKVADRLEKAGKTKGAAKYRAYSQRLQKALSNAQFISANSELNAPKVLGRLSSFLNRLGKQIALQTSPYNKKIRAEETAISGLEQQRKAALAPFHKQAASYVKAIRDSNTAISVIDNLMSKPSWNNKSDAAKNTVLSHRASHVRTIEAARNDLRALGQSYVKQTKPISEEILQRRANIGKLRQERLANAKSPFAALPQSVRMVQDAKAAGLLPQNYDPVNGFSVPKFQLLPNAINTFEQAEAAGYLDKTYVQGAWKPSELADSKNGVRAQAFKTAHEELTKEQTALQSKQAELKVHQAMAPVIGRGGTADQMNSARSKVSAIQKRMDDLQKIAAQRDLTLDEQLKYVRLRENLAIAGRDLEKKEVAHDKAVAKASAKMRKEFSGTQEYKDMKAAEKSGDQQRIKETTAAFNNMVRSSVGYKSLVEQREQAAQLHEKTKEGVQKAKDAQENLKAKKAANDKAIEESRKKGGRASEEIKKLEAKYRGVNGKNGPAWSDEDKARYAQLQEEKKTAGKEVGRLRGENRKIVEKQQPLLSNAMQEEKAKESLAQKHLERTEQSLRAYGQALPGSPEYRARNNFLKKQATLEAASGRAKMREAGSKAFGTFQNFGKGVQTVTQYVKELGKGLMGAGDSAKRATLKLKAAAVGFNLAAFAAQTFSSMMTMVGTMLQMTVVMAVVSAIIGMFTWLGKWIGATFKSDEEQAAERRAKIKEKYEEKTGKAKERQEEVKEENENRANKIERLRELSKKETLTESEAIEAKKISDRFGNRGAGEAFKMTPTLNDNNDVVYQSNINEEALNDFEKQNKKDLQKASLNKINEILKGTYKFWDSDEYQNDYQDVSYDDLIDALETLESAGPIEKDSPEWILLKQASQKINDASSNDHVKGRTKDRYENVRNRLLNLEYGAGAGGQLVDVDEIRQGLEPFKKDVDELSSKRKVDPSEIQDAYSAYIDQIQNGLETIRKNFDTASNKNDLKKAADELKKDLDSAYEAYQKASIKIRNEIRRSMPSYGGEAVMNEIIDNSIKGLDWIEKGREAELKDIDTASTRDLESTISNINKEYEQYETVDDIKTEFHQKIGNLPSTLSLDEQQKMTNELHARYQERINASLKLGDTEFIKSKQAERDQKIQDAKDANEKKKEEDKKKANDFYDQRRQGVFNSVGSNLRDKLDKEIENSMTATQKQFAQARNTHAARLQSLNNAVDLKVEEEFEQETIDLAKLEDDLSADDYNKKVEDLATKKSNRRKALLESDEYKNQRAEINKEYEQAVNPENFEVSTSGLESFQRAKAVKQQKEQELERKRQAIAENAVKSDQMRLNELNNINPNQLTAEQKAEIASLQEKIAKDRQAAYDATAEMARQKQDEIDREYEKAISPDNLLVGSNSYQNTVINEDQQRRQADERVENWRKAVAENAVLEDKTELRERRGKEQTAEDKELNDALEASIETKRQTAYDETASDAKEKKSALYQEIDDAFTREQFSKSFVSQQKFNTVDRNLEYEAKSNLDYLAAAQKENQKIVDNTKRYGETNEALQQNKDDLGQAYLAAAMGATEFNGVDIGVYITSLENLIESEEKFLEGHEQDVEDYNNATKRLADVKLLKTIADSYYEAAKRMQEIKAEYARKQFDYGLKMFGKESVELNAERERDVKLTELKRDYDERIAYVEDEAEKERFEKSYNDAVAFINKQADFKKKNALAEQNDFSRPIQKKAAEITVRWQQEIIDALEANGIGLDEVSFDENGAIRGKSARASRLVKMGNATRDAQIAAEEFSEEKANQDYQNDVAKYTGSQSAINDLDLAIESLQAFSGSANPQMSQAVEYQTNQMKYNKALLETRQFDAQLATLQDQAGRAYEIWQDAVKNGATDEEKRNAFERYKQLVDEMQSVKTSMVGSFKDMRESRREMASAAVATEKSNTGTFKAMEASRNSQDWQRENAVRQTVLLKQIADNTGFGGEII